MLMCSKMVAGRYFLAFDHQGVFPHGRAELSATAESAMVAAKELIFDAIELAATEIPVSLMGVLIDKRYGGRVPERARHLGVTLGMSAGSTADGCSATVGDALREAILAAQPDLVKVLVRHNAECRLPATRDLRVLSDSLATEGLQLLVQLLVPPTEQQLRRASGDVQSFEEDIRPDLICRAIGQLQDAGIEPTTWKVEGVYRCDDAEAVVAAARRDGRDAVDCVLLGSGAPVVRVNRWLRVAAKADGFVGFAIGRSIWWPFLDRYLTGAIDRRAAVTGIAATYTRFIDVFADPRNAGAPR